MLGSKLSRTPADDGLVPVQTGNAKQAPEHVKEEHSAWVVLLVLFIILTLSIVGFVLGCVARIAFTHHLQINWVDITDLSPTNKQEEAVLPLNEETILSPTQVCSEAIVHPGMLTHSNPKRVTLVGQSAYALNEVLKHRTVDQVDVYTAVEDDVFMNSTISHVNGAVIQTYHLLQSKVDHYDTKSDVILVKSPGNFNSDGPSIGMYYELLADDGVLVLTLGDENKIADFIEQLQAVGFKSIHLYEERHCVSTTLRLTAVALKDYKARSQWYRNEAELQIQIHRRIQSARSAEEPPLIHLDASIIVSYQVPSKVIENIFCQNGGECGANFNLPADVRKIPASSLEVRKSTVSEMAGRGIFAAEDIPRHSVLALDLQMNNFFVPPSSWKIIGSVFEIRNEMNEIDNKLYQGVLYFIQGYGYGSQLMGETHWTIDSWYILFSNHGCNFTFNYGSDSVMELSEHSVSLDLMPDNVEGNEAKPYSPFQERHLREYLGSGDYTLRGIKKGEEILSNYLSFVDPSEWSEEVLILRSQCCGEEVGEINDYESGEKSYY